ncbi:MAG: hypothetical protein WBA00_13535 [Rhodococcus sp. (in: high G+C Gram-positive bacteria)]
MSITKSVALAWDVVPLSHVRREADSVVAAIDRDADVLWRTVSGMDWSGDASEAALHRAESDSRRFRSVAAAVESIGAAVSSGQAAMGPLLDDLTSTVQGMTIDSFAVGEDWAVTDVRMYLPGDAAEDALRAARQEEAITMSVRLTGLARALADADTACAAAVDAAVAEMATHAPVTAGLGADVAETDAAAVRDGTADARVWARIEAASEMTPQESADLAAGRPVSIPMGRFEYLRALMDAQDGVTVADMADAAAGAPPEHRGALIDAMQVVSNPHVEVTGSLGEGKPTTQLAVGGMHQLPEEMQSLLTQSPLQQVDGSTVGFERRADFEVLTQMMRDGDPAVAQGSDLDRGILKQASEIGAYRDGGLVRDRSTPWDPETIQVLDSMGEPLTGRPPIGDLASDMFSVAAGDHVAVHDFVTGENMDVTVSDGGVYNAEQHVLRVLQTPWEPDQHGAAEMFDWLAGPDATSPDPAVQAQAGETAFGLAQVLSDNSVQLAPPGPGSMGDINPELTRSIATDLSPYLPNFAGVRDDDLLANHGAERFETVSDLSSMFRVLDTDPVAAQTINTAGAVWSNEMAYQAGVRGDDPFLGFNAAQLQSAMDMGLTDRLEDLREQQRYDNIVEYYDTVATADAAAGALSAIPGAGAIAGVAPLAINSMYDAPNNPADLAGDAEWEKALNGVRNSTLQDPLIRQYLVMDGYAQSHSDEVGRFRYRDDNGYEAPFMNDGHLSWDAVTQYDSDFRQAVQISDNETLADFEAERRDGGDSRRIIPDPNPILDRPRR